eukprot:TRINITY_DN3748_c0_g1_i1.p1 TRINITY_DN3748_c0_g1~~TRINITY_DN3748_c0_g1_i1.p1  ORF type:complete len:177 (-),score=53.38 TRINITY_DN3748_c0_g1_i1:25-486(-)
MEEIGITLRGCSAEDIVDGNVNVILSIVWVLVYNSVQLQFLPVTNMVEAKKMIMDWVKDSISGKTNVKVDDLETGWQDGLAFAAIVNKFRPDIIDFNAALNKGPAVRLEFVLGSLKTKLNMPEIIKVADMMQPYKPDERSMFAFLVILKELLK